jgi:iron(II)-dependent oxidoreductase
MAYIIMAGNAAEWVEDWFGIDYYATMPDRSPGPCQRRYKVVRGGSWKSAPTLLRTATRGRGLTGSARRDRGFSLRAVGAIVDVDCSL